MCVMYVGCVLFLYVMYAESVNMFYVGV